MTYFENLQTYLNDGFIYAKSHPNVQKCYRISYEKIVQRRAGDEFTTPCGSNINDFVPFYFSPSTKMSFSIHSGNVPLRSPDGMDVGIANMNDVAYIIASPQRLFASDRQCWFTNIACNSAIPPEYCDNTHKISTHVNWELFDEADKMGRIDEIQYEGVCRWQQDRDTPQRYQMRSKERMAEFMIKDYLQTDEIKCIVLKSNDHLNEVQSWVDASDTRIPIYVKPGCYF